MQAFRSFSGLLTLIFSVAMVACGPREYTCVDCGWTAPPHLLTSQLAFDSDRTGNYEIYLMNTDGSGVRALTNDRTQDSWWPRISPERARILFYRTPAGTHDGDYTKTSLWEMNADGSDSHQVIANGANG